MKLYAGCDLHSTNNFWGILDETGKRIFAKKLPNSPEKILKTLEPFKCELSGIGIPGPGSNLCILPKFWNKWSKPGLNDSGKGLDRSISSRLSSVCAGSKGTAWSQGHIPQHQGELLWNFMYTPGTDCCLQPPFQAWNGWSKHWKQPSMELFSWYVNSLHGSDPG